MFYQELTQKRVAIANTGVILVLLSDGELAFNLDPMNFVPMVDVCRGGVTGVFAVEGFTLVSKDEDHVNFEYGTVYPYKEIPLLKQWLEQQKLLWSEELPF